MLVDPSRVAAVRLLIETNLAAAVLPEIVPQNDEQIQRLEQALTVLNRLKDPAFPLALAALLHNTSDTAGVKKVSSRWRLSNKETDRAVWLVENQRTIIHPQAMKWSALQPFLIHEGINDLLELMEAGSPEGDKAAAYCLNKLLQPPEILDPLPLVTGEDLLALGIPQGPRYRILLDEIRRTQLDGILQNRIDAINYLKDKNNLNG
jgi:poly(A) polymerase